MPDTVEFFTASSGKVSARIVYDNGQIRHLHSTVAPEQEAGYFEQLSFTGSIIIFAGIGLGYHIAGKLKKIPEDALLIVIDYHDACIEFCKNTLFNNLQNTIIFVSSSTDDALLNSVRESIINQRCSPVQCVRHPASYDAYRAFYESVLKKICVPYGKTFSSASMHKKALLLHGNFFLQQEVQNALRGHAHSDPVIFPYEEYTSGIAYEQALQRVIAAEKPDYILSVNMKGFDGNGILSTIAERFSIPAAVWFVDDPHPILLNQRKNISGNMIAFCWEKAYLQFLSEAGFSKTSYLPLAADPSLFHEAAIEIEPATPLGFVGSAMGMAFLHSIKSRFLWNNTLQELVDIASDRILSDPSAAVGNILGDVLRKTNVSLPFTDERNKTWLCSFIIHLASMKKRKKMIEALLSLAIETFGDPDGWKELCGDTLITHPDIDYRSQLCGVYQNIDVNINITSCQMKTAVNQRVFDVPMAGSFIISDNQQALVELFELGSQAVCYASVDELKTLIRYYKNNRQARKELTTRARYRILEEHTYGHRVKTILSYI